MRIRSIKKLYLNYWIFTCESSVILNVIWQFAIKAVISILVFVVLNPHIVKIVNELTDEFTCDSASVVIVADVILVNINLVTVIQYCVSIVKCAAKLYNIYQIRNKHLDILHILYKFGYFIIKNDNIVCILK